MEPKEKLKKLIEHYGGTRRAFAEIIGVEEPTVASWLFRNQISGKGIASILRHCEGVDEEWLTDTRITREAQSVSGPYYSDIPVSAGQIMWAEQREDTNEYIYFPGVKADAFLPVSGISMEPLIHDGDIVGVVNSDGASFFDRNAIYLIIAQEGIRAIKYVERDGDCLVLISANPDVAPFRVPMANVIHIFRVVFSGRKY